MVLARHERGRQELPVHPCIYSHGGRVGEVSSPETGRPFAALGEGSGEVGYLRVMVDQLVMMMGVMRG